MDNEKIRKLNRKIPDCFGEKDHIFGGHRRESEKARDLLKKYWKNNLSFERYIKAMETYLKGLKLPSDHIANQLERARDIENYFK
jgi:hypothetical protein